MYTTVIADDEKLICDTILTILNTAIPELKSIKVFHNGAEAYNYVQLNKVDILLLDIEMAGKSGLDIAQLVSRQRNDSYVIIITAYQDFEYAKKAIDYDVDAFLTKPISSEQLVDSVRKALDFFNKKKKQTNSQQEVYRSLLQALCSDSTLPFHEGFLLCKGTTSINELLCTEVLLKDPCLLSLSLASLSSMIEVITETIEKDTENQSVFLLEHQKVVKFLIFSKGTPELNFITDAMQIISFYTSNMPQAETKTHSSLAAYRSYLCFAREVDAFFHEAIEGNLKLAQKKLTIFLQSLSALELDNFANYLSENFHITIERLDIDTILQSMRASLGHFSNGQPSNYIVISACDYIHQNFNSSMLSLETTADALSVSGAHLSRLFKKHTGRTFSDYLLNVRMEHAKLLLETTNLPTPDIAEATGYDKSAYFRTAFKSYFGMTPLQYRQTIINK